MKNDRVRVLYSFPHKLGADRICYTAWQQVNGLAAAGADVLAAPGVLHRPVPQSVKVNPTLSWGKLRIPYKLFGKMRAIALHDGIVARRLKKLVGKIDLVHAWPAAAIKTLKAAKELGIPTVLERPNAHTRFAFDAVGKEFARLGIELPPDDEYSFKPDLLKREEEEYNLADYIICPSDFVVQTFVDQGVPQEKLIRHIYGYDEKTYFSEKKENDSSKGLNIIFVGVCAVRKGLHFALEAWLNSSASKNGTFSIAGSFLPTYAEYLSGMLEHPSVRVLGFRNDVPDLMRKNDILILPSVEEGSALVVNDAIGSGCVPLVSEATTGVVQHMENGLIHKVGDVKTIEQQITMLHEDRQLLQKLREGALKLAPEVTWNAAGRKLLSAYREVLNKR